MAAAVAESGAEVCLMHMLGEPRTMQDDPRYEDVVSEVKAFLEERLGFAVAHGIPEERVWLDPGIGFGKTLEHNLELLRRLDEIVALGRPVVVGVSRKRFIGSLTGPSGGRPHGGRRSRPTCWHSSAEPTCSACTTWPRPGMRWRSRLLRWATPLSLGPGVTLMESWEEREHEDQEVGSSDSYVTVEISGLSLFTHHGATEAEQQTGQRMVFDITFEVEDCDATVTDRLDDTIDYAAVCQAVALVATERSYRTLERVCTAVADMVEERFGASGVVVRATKPEPPIPLPVEEVSVEVSR